MQKIFKIKRKIKEKDLAWIAGITDGEGCIHVNKTKPNAKAGEINTKYALRVRIAMTHQKTIKHIYKILGFGNVYFRKRQKYNEKNQYAWEVSSLQASEFLKIILPFLITKRKEAKWGIKFMEIPRLYCMKQGVSKEILSKRKKIYLKLRSLKQGK